MDTSHTSNLRRIVLAIGDPPLDDTEGRSLVQDMTIAVIRQQSGEDVDVAVADRLMDRYQQWKRRTVSA